MAAQDEGSRSTTLMVVIWVFTAICLVIVSIRLLLRKLTRNSGLDDLFIVVATLVNLAVAIDATIAVHWGLGRHHDTLTDHQKYEVQKPTILLHSLLLMSFALPKLSVAALLVRLFSHIPTWQKVLLYGLSIYLIIGCFIVAVFHWTQCDPIARQWDPSLDGSCWDPRVIADASLWLGISSAILDLFYATFPLWILKNLHIERQKKISIGALLGLGIIACALCIYKNTKVLELQDRDPTFGSWQLILWTDVEANILIVAASIPTFAVVLKLAKNFGQKHGLVESSGLFIKDSSTGDSLPASSLSNKEPSEESLP